MKTLLKYLIVLLLVFSFDACTKNKLGGSSEVKGTVIHHSAFVPGVSVFIKFNAKEFPGKDTTKYDAKVLADSKGLFSFKCYKGDYFLYAFGYDDSYKKNVSGGVPVKIRTGETLEIVVAVDE